MLPNEAHNVNMRALVKSSACRYLVVWMPQHSQLPHFDLHPLHAGGGPACRCTFWLTCRVVCTHVRPALPVQHTHPCQPRGSALRVRTDVIGQQLYGSECMHACGSPDDDVVVLVACSEELMKVWPGQFLHACMQPRMQPPSVHPTERHHSTNPSQYKCCTQHIAVQPSACWLIHATGKSPLNTLGVGMQAANKCAA